MRPARKLWNFANETASTGFLTWQLLRVFLPSVVLRQLTSAAKSTVTDGASEGYAVARGLVADAPGVVVRNAEKVMGGPLSDG